MLRATNSFSIRMIICAIAVVGGTEAAVASGYESATMWGGRTAGMAGISTPWISGSEALYFNPAGLVKPTPGQDVSFNISPTWSQYSGPINDQNAKATSTMDLSTPLGLIYGNTINDKIGFGVGAFISGGSTSTFDNVDFPGYADKPDIKTDLAISEVSAGLAYKFSNDFKLGFALRLVMADADFSTITRMGGGTLINSKLTGLKDSDTIGYRIGTQFKVAEGTHVGVNYRSEVDFAAKGRMHNDQIDSSTVTDLGDLDATVSTKFPQQITVGVEHIFSEKWRGVAEYAWTNYSVNKKVGINASDDTFDSSVTQNWKDENAIRVGAEYSGWSWPLRFGYGWTSEVTNKDYTLAGFVPPGALHSITAGTGHEFDLKGKTLRVDGAVEYAFGSGTANGATGGDTNDFRAGKYAVSGVALHLGVGYSF